MQPRKNEDISTAATFHGKDALFIDHSADAIAGAYFGNYLVRRPKDLSLNIANDI